MKCNKKYILCKRIVCKYAAMKTQSAIKYSVKSKLTTFPNWWICINVKHQMFNILAWSSKDYCIYTNLCKPVTLQKIALVDKILSFGQHFWSIHFVFCCVYQSILMSTYFQLSVEAPVMPRLSARTVRCHAGLFLASCVILCLLG